MDHRCLYGHRVPAAFTFAIQSRNCPTCGSPTVTLDGYQAARKLASDGGLEAVAAFHVVRLLEADWVLTPAIPPAPDAKPAAAGALVAEPAPGAAVAEEEVVVVEDEVVVVASEPAPPAPSPVAPPEPRITARVKGEDGRKDTRARTIDRDEPRVSTPSAALGAGFGDAEEDFFKGA